MKAMMAFTSQQISSILCWLMKTMMVIRDYERRTVMTTFRITVTYNDFTNEHQYIRHDDNKDYETTMSNVAEITGNLAKQQEDGMIRSWLLESMEDSIADKQEKIENTEYLMKTYGITRKEDEEWSLFKGMMEYYTPQGLYTAAMLAHPITYYVKGNLVIFRHSENGDPKLVDSCFMPSFSTDEEIENEIVEVIADDIKWRMLREKKGETK